MAPTDVSDVLKTLRRQRAHARKEVKALEKAIAVLRGVVLEVADARPEAAQDVGGGSEEDWCGAAQTVGESASR